jgi:aspartate/methionine/tyrosine aminotransferase
MLALASESFSAVSAPIQYAAVTAFSDEPAIVQYVENCRRILKVISNYVHAQLLSMGITMPCAEGGFYLFPNFGPTYAAALRKRGVVDSTTLTQVLLTEAGIALLPGVAFGRATEELTCRLSYVDFDGAALLRLIAASPTTTDTEILEECPRITAAMAALRTWLQELGTTKDGC